MVNPILDPSHALAERLKSIEATTAGLSTQPLLLNASTGQIGGGTPGLATDATGLQAYNSNGVLVNFLETNDGTMRCFDAAGTEQARMGALLSNPGNYGLEIWTGTAWQQVASATSVAWSAITGKPSTYPATVPVESATTASSCSGNAATASHTPQSDNSTWADGSQHAYNNNVAGTSFYAVWVGNDTYNGFGKNVSSIRFKSNVRAHMIDPAEVLQIQPVIFDRQPVLVDPPPGSEGPSNLVGGPFNEFGLIAEQVNEHVPEIVQWYAGEIDGLRYDLLPVAQQSVLIDHDGRVAALETMLAAALARIDALEKHVQTTAPQWSPPTTTPPVAYQPPAWHPNIPAYAAPAIQPPPAPYIIQP